MLFLAPYSLCSYGVRGGMARTSKRAAGTQTAEGNPRGWKATNLAPSYLPLIKINSLIPVRGGVTRDKGSLEVAGCEEQRVTVCQNQNKPLTSVSDRLSLQQACNKSRRRPPLRSPPTVFWVSPDSAHRRSATCNTKTCRPLHTNYGWDQNTIIIRLWGFHSVECNPTSPGSN